MVPGHADAIWAHFSPAVHAPIVPNLPPMVDAGTTIGDHIFFSQNCAKDIARVCNEGFAVDDNNDPALKNIQGIFTPPLDDAGLFEGQSWGWDGIDRRQMAGGGDTTMHLSVTVSPPSGRPTSSFSCTSSQWLWFSDILLPQTSADVINTGTTPVTFGELLHFLGLHLTGFHSVWITV